MPSSEPTPPGIGSPNRDESQEAPSAWSSFSSLFSSPSSLRERFQEFDDKQRIERLSACQQLDAILRDCRKRHGESSNGSDIDIDNRDDPIESVSIGLRNMKYFGWRGILAAPPPATEENSAESQPTISDSLRKQIRSSCSREQHAVWACRAVATGCGKDLSELKKCFETNDSSNDLLLTTPYTNYEGYFDNSNNSNNDSKLDRNRLCFDTQRTLGSCVMAGGKDLLERKQRRERGQQR